MAPGFRQNVILPFTKPVDYKYTQRNMHSTQGLLSLSWKSMLGRMASIFAWVKNKPSILQLWGLRKALNYHAMAKHIRRFR